MIQRALADDLCGRLPARLVGLPGDPVPQGITQLTVTIERVRPDATGQVVPPADWTLRGAMLRQRTSNSCQKPPLPARTPP